MCFLPRWIYTNVSDTIVDQLHFRFNYPTLRRWSAISKNNFGSDSREVKRDLVKRRDTPGHKNTFLIVGPHELHEGSRQGACEGHNRESSVPLFQQARRPEENTHFIVGEY